MDYKVNRNKFAKDEPYTIGDMVSQGCFKFGLDSIPSEDTVRKMVEERAVARFGKDFRFRTYQLETISDIIRSFFTNRVYVLEAPTGSGKSITALLAADVLSTYFGLKGYILISDLSLIEQYRNDIVKHFPDFGLLKGQESYTCSENGYSYRCGTCKLKGLPRTKARCMECYSHCAYNTARDHALVAPVTLMTYAGWFIQRNVIAKIDTIEPNDKFFQREFVICDEAHKVPDIIQDAFSPIISKKDAGKIALIARAVKKKYDSKIDSGALTYTKYINSIFHALDGKDTFDALVAYLNALHAIMKNISGSSSLTENAKATNETRDMVKNTFWIQEYYRVLHEYVEMISMIGIESMVKNKVSDEEYKFNCLDESHLFQKKFYANAGNVLFMSATIGEGENYKTAVDAKDALVNTVPSTFDFSRSPIYYNHKYALSYEKKVENLPKSVKMIEQIAGIRPGMRGIIQTGSYEFMKYLEEHASPELKKRLITYSDSSEKDVMIEKYKESEDMILVGPSLVEGIDFKDDLCRFIIVMKIPFPSLGDELVARKARLNQTWYVWKTVNSILQGVGRGVRNENDWCETYIIDGSFTSIMSRNRNLIPDSFVWRIVNISEWFNV